MNYYLEAASIRLKRQDAASTLGGYLSEIALHVTRAAELRIQL
jgi:hypothetical protein